MKKVIYSILIFLALLIIIFVGTVYYLKKTNNDHGCDVPSGYIWCDVLQKCIIKEEEKCELPDERTKLMEGIREVFGMGLNPISWPIGWNLKEGESFFDGVGYYYTDLLQSEKIRNIFKSLGDYFKQNGFVYDFYNPPVKTDKKESLAYKKDNIICNVFLVDNPNKTSSLFTGCSYADKIICDAAAECGTKCNIDSDCRAVIDGCNKKTACKNAGFKYFDNCNVSIKSVSNLNLDVQFCQCLNNKCAPKEAGANIRQ